MDYTLTPSILPVSLDSFLMSMLNSDPGPVSGRSPIFTAPVGEANPIGFLGTLSDGRAASLFCNHKKYVKYNISM